MHPAVKEQTSLTLCTWMHAMRGRSPPMAGSLELDTTPGRMRRRSACPAAHQPLIAASIAGAALSSCRSELSSSASCGARPAWRHLPTSQPSAAVQATPPKARPNAAAASLKGREPWDHP